jgi:hypothetical protein
LASGEAIVSSGRIAVLVGKASDLEEEFVPVGWASEPAGEVSISFEAVIALLGEEPAQSEEAFDWVVQIESPFGLTHEPPEKNGKAFEQFENAQVPVEEVSASASAEAAACSPEDLAAVQQR